METRRFFARNAARDVYDAVSLAERHKPWPPVAAPSAFEFLSGTLSRPLTRYNTSRLGQLHEAEAKQNLEPMLATADALSVPNLMEHATAALASMLVLNDNQRRFVEALERGELRPELIFETTTAERLMLHPHLRWKVQNVRKHLGLD